MAGTQDKKSIQLGAVIVPFFRRGEELYLVLVRRGDGGVHGGQLAFPGGKPDPGDSSMLETALRETEEEIGLSRSQIEIIETLPAMETLTTNYRIHAYAARVKLPGLWHPRQGEIAEVIEVKVGDLQSPAAQGEAMMMFTTWSGPQRRPFIRVGEHRLWGVSYRILKPLLARIASGDLTL